MTRSDTPQGFAEACEWIDELRACIAQLERERDAALVEVEWYAIIARFLWTLLDNIDTLDDAVRDNDSAFRHNTRIQQKRRWEVGNSDGYTVTFKERAALAPAKAEGE